MNWLINYLEECAGKYFVYKNKKNREQESNSWIANSVTGTERTTESVLVRSLIHLGKVCMLSHVRFFVTPWAAAHQAPVSMQFSRQEYWSGLLFLSPRILPNPGIEPTSPVSPASTGEFFTSVLGGLAGFPCSPRNSQVSSPASELEKSINSSVLSFLYWPTVTSIHEYWKNQFD